MNYMIFQNVKMIIKKIIKYLFLPFIIVLFVLFTDAFADETWTWNLYFSWTRIFESINYDSFKNELNKEVLNIDYWSWNIWTFETINYQEDLNDIKEILYQILLVNFFVWFFFLTWIFYSFKNDLLWKK